MNYACPHCHKAVELPDPVPEDGSFACSHCQAKINAWTDLKTIEKPKDPETVSVSDTATTVCLPNIGDIFGRYEIQGVLGRGGMGLVYRAHDRELRRDVALKVVQAGGGGSLPARFLEEARRSARLGHPGIVSIYDVGTIDDVPYFTMELVEGGTLRQWLGTERSTRDTIAMFARIAEAVGAAHASGIIHRDLKPGNVLLDESGQPHITDFGLSKDIESAEQLTQSGDLLGTPDYMSPEQARGETAVTGPASDVFSLGTMLYEMLAGIRPFSTENLYATLQRIKDEDPPPPSRHKQGLPREADAICLTCLYKEPALRYATAAELAADCQRYLDGDPVLAVPPSFGYRARRWATKRRIPLAAAGAIGVVCLAAVMWYFSLPGGVNLDSLPRGARAFRLKDNDWEPCGTTPLTIERLSAGTHQFRLEHPLCDPQKIEVSVGHGSNVVRKVELVSKAGMLALSSHAGVNAVNLTRIDPAPSGNSSQSLLQGDSIDLVEGGYSLSIDRPNHIPMSLAIEIERQQSLDCSPFLFPYVLREYRGFSNRFTPSVVATLSETGRILYVTVPDLERSENNKHLLRALDLADFSVLWQTEIPDQPLRLYCPQEMPDAVCLTFRTGESTAFRLADGDLLSVTPPSFSSGGQLEISDNLIQSPVGEGSWPLPLSEGERAGYAKAMTFVDGPDAILAGTAKPSPLRGAVYCFSPKVNQYLWKLQTDWPQRQPALPIPGLPARALVPGNDGVHRIVSVAHIPPAWRVQVPGEIHALFPGNTSGQVFLSGIDDKAPWTLKVETRNGSLISRMSLLADKALLYVNEERIIAASGSQIHCLSGDGMRNLWSYQSKQNEAPVVFPMGKFFVFAWPREAVLEGVDIEDGHPLWRREYDPIFPLVLPRRPAKDDMRIAFLAEGASLELLSCTSGQSEGRIKLKYGEEFPLLQCQGNTCHAYFSKSNRLYGIDCSTKAIASVLSPPFEMKESTSSHMALLEGSVFLAKGRELVRIHNGEAVMAKNFAENAIGLFVNNASADLVYAGARPVPLGYTCFRRLRAETLKPLGDPVYIDGFVATEGKTIRKGDEAELALWDRKGRLAAYSLEMNDD